MFKLMWSMKKKGDKPHYKPGTDKKYKKYQEDWKPEGIDEAERNWYRGYDSGDKTVPRRKALNRADEFDNRGQNERADKIRSIAAKKDQGRHYEAKKDAKKIKISDKIGKLRPASIDDKRGAVSGDVQKKLSSSYELEGEVIDERVGGTGTLVRQGVKVGGKKGGRAVQAGQDAAVKAGQGAKAKAAQGNQSKMIGTGRAEKIGAVAGGLAGGVALGALDGPVPVGDIVGGIAGSKIGGKIGRQVDKAGSAVKKAVVGEGIVDKVVKHYRDKKKPKKHQYPGRDAGKLAKDRLADKEHNKYVNFLPAEKD